MLRHRLSVLASVPPGVALVLVTGLLALSWALVYVAGGSHTALPHVFYLPVVVAVIPFGRRGGIVAGLAATILCGPLMPLDVAAGTVQGADNWLVRGVFFVTVGALAGLAARAVAVRFEDDLSDHLARELHPDVDVADQPADTAARIRAVVDHRRFSIVLQPIYSLDDGTVLAVEALTRFAEAEPLQSPDVWFAQARRVGLGVDLEIVTARAALEATVDLPRHVALSINASPACLHDERMHDLLDEHAGRHLIVEITEHATVDDYSSLQVTLDTLRARGVRIAVDDAGAGFASLRHVLRLTPDIIKLDIDLTQNVRDDRVRRALANALVQFAHDTNTQLIAEGVETVADLVTWQSIGAHAAQGYLLARPAPAPICLEPAAGVARRLPRRFAPVELAESVR